MQIYSVLGSLSTALSFVLFIGIVVWAWSERRDHAFAEAAQEPFALPDDLRSSVAIASDGSASGDQRSDGGGR